MYRVEKNWGLVEFHPDPQNAFSDGPQSLPLVSLPDFYRQIGKIANAVSRELI